MSEELISIGQALITKEQYLADKKYYDDAGFIGVVGTEAPSGLGESISEIGDSVTNIINDIVSNVTIKYKFNGGSKYTEKPFSNKLVKLDDVHLVTWILFESGYSTMSVSDVQDARKTLEYSDLFKEVSPESTSSDANSYKYEIMSNGLLGDVLFFDTYQKNGTVGLYLGNGDFITVDDTGNETDLVQYSLWFRNDIGEIEYTEYMKKFNGTIKRIPRFNEDDYKWYVETTIGN